MAAEVAVPVAGERGLAHRAAVTATAVVLLVISQRVVLPFVDADVVRGEAGGGLLSLARGLLRFVSWGSLGLWPLFEAFVLVELVAATAPPLRPLRETVPGRTILRRAAWIAALPIATLQAWGLAVELSTLRDGFGFPVLPLDGGAIFGVTAALVGGTALLATAAAFVSRRGLGNGFAVLFGVQALEQVVGAGIRAAAGSPFPWTEAGAILVLGVVLLPVVFAFRPRAATWPRVTEPTSGLVPVLAPPYVLDFPWKVAAWFPAAVPLAERLERALGGAGAGARAAASISIAAILAVAFARAFYPPREVVAAFERGASPEAPAADATVVRRALLWANARSVAVVVGIAAFPTLADALGVPFAIRRHDLVAAFIGVAVALDLRDEAAARSRGAPLASAWAAHRVFAVAPALAALERAGIPAHARARRYRALFQTFAPYVPIEILVPVDRVAEAARVCARVLAPPGP